jgi:hypothetical protein
MPLALGCENMSYDHEIDNPWEQVTHTSTIQPVRLWCDVRSRFLTDVKYRIHLNSLDV